MYFLTLSEHVISLSLSNLCASPVNGKAPFFPVENHHHVTLTAFYHMLSPLCCIFVPLLLAAVADGDTECGDGWHFSGSQFEDGSGRKDFFCYRTTDRGEYTWDQAERACVNYGEGAHLILFMHKNIFVGTPFCGTDFHPFVGGERLVGQCFQAGLSGFWLGMKRVTTDGSFGKPYFGTFKQSWSDGSQVNYGAAIRDRPNGRGGPWAPNQPDYNSTPIENCVMSYAFTDYFVNPYDLTSPQLYNKWNDVVCGPATVPNPADRRHITGTLVQGLCKKRAVPCKD